jgi:hypothetical protein
MIVPPPLAYATKPAPLPGVTITVADDEVALTKAPARGVLLGTLITLTILYAALWTMRIHHARRRVCQQTGNTSCRVNEPLRAGRGTIRRPMSRSRLAHTNASM